MQPGIIHIVEIPSVKENPTSPSITHPDSADAQDEIAATQAPSFLLARKKSKFDI